MDGITPRLAAIWRVLLGTARVGLDDDFTDLGGHSVFVMEMLGRVADEFAVTITIDDVLTFRTVRSLAHRIETLCAGQAAGLTKP
jgi:acyl carrier protein